MSTKTTLFVVCLLAGTIAAPIIQAQSTTCRTTGQGCPQTTAPSDLSNWDPSTYDLIPQGPMPQTIIQEAPERIIETRIERVEVPVQELVYVDRPVEVVRYEQILPEVRKEAYIPQPMTIGGAEPIRPIMSVSADPLDRPSTAERLPQNLENVVPPFSRFIGKVETTVSSDVPGPFVVMVDRAVYGYTGQRVLVPVGSRIVCQHMGIADNSLARIAATCTDLFTQDGRHANLRDAPLAGADGSLGPLGRRDERLFQRYGATLGLSLARFITDTTTTTTASTTDDQQVILNATDDWVTELTKITDDIFEDRQSLPATVNLPAGSIVVLQPLTSIEFL